MDKTELRERLFFRKAALKNLRKAYLALTDGGAKSYTIGDRTVTHLDLRTLAGEIKQMEQEVDALQTQLNNKAPRLAFGVVPMDDW